MSKYYCWFILFAILGGDILKKRIDEVFFIRSIACLCVVFVHSITRVMDLYASQLTSFSQSVFWTIRLIFTFGTPIFIFLSEFLLSYSYPQGLPKDFMRKRLKFILLPYISMSFIYAVVMMYERGGLVASTLLTYMLYVVENLAFGFYRHGYFILVIFQFYFIHMLFHKKLKQWNPVVVLITSFVINLLFLGFFSFVEPLKVSFGQQLWNGLSWGSFPAWVFYFTLGYYAGGNYETFKNKLKEHVKLVFTLPLLTLVLVLYLHLNEIITINSSKRVDMIFFATSMIFLLFYLSINVVKIPKFFIWLSGYSFGIYLFHMFFLAFMTGFINTITYQQVSPVVMLGLLFTMSTTASIITTFILGKFPIGTFIVGKVGGKKIEFNRWKKLLKITN